jgi:hypothetical protein
MGFKTENKFKINTTFWRSTPSILFFVILLCWVTGAFHQVKKPGSFLEKSNYRGKFYVLVFPGNDKVKNYKLPGDIDKSEDCDSENNSCSSNYRLSNIYWPSFGRTSFSDCSIIINNKSLCTSDEGRDYYIELTSESAK